MLQGGWLKVRDKVNFGAEQGYAPSDVGAGESGVGKSHLNKVHLVKIMRMLNTLGQECMTATTDGDTSTWRTIGQRSGHARRL